MKSICLAVLLLVSAACSQTLDGGECEAPPALAAGGGQTFALSCAVEVSWNGKAYGVSGGKFDESWVGARIAGQGETEYASAYRLRTYPPEEVLVLESRRKNKVRFLLAFAHTNSWDEQDDRKVKAPFAEGRVQPEVSAATELAEEFEFVPYPGNQWYAPDGTEVDKEASIINAITGPDHCEWQSAVLMHVGWPLGIEAADSTESRQFLRDPEGLFRKDMLMATFDDNTAVPNGAEYSGYRTDFMELWLDDEDEAAAYLVFADHAERWPRAKEAIACG